MKHYSWGIFQPFRGRPMPRFRAGRGYFVKASQRGKKNYNCVGKSLNNKA